MMVELVWYGLWALLGAALTPPIHALVVWFLGRPTEMVQAGTMSGETYVINPANFRVMGGSKRLRHGHLVPTQYGLVVLGEPLRVRAPERANVNPSFVDPGVRSTPVIFVSTATRRDVLSAWLGSFRKVG